MASLQLPDRSAPRIRLVSLVARISQFFTCNGYLLSTTAAVNEYIVLRRGAGHPRTRDAPFPHLRRLYRFRPRSR